MPLNEADTCRTYVLPKLYSAGWEDAQISEQKNFTDGRIVIGGKRPIRRPQKRADYLLRYRRDFPIAVVEAKAVYRTPGDGLQQAKEYAQILGLKFAIWTPPALQARLCFRIQDRTADDISGLCLPPSRRALMTIRSQEPHDWLGV